MSSFLWPVHLHVSHWRNPEQYYEQCRSHIFHPRGFLHFQSIRKFTEHCSGQQILLHVRKFYLHGEIIIEDKQLMTREKRQCKIILPGAVNSAKLQMMVNLQTKFKISILNVHQSHYRCANSLDPWLLIQKSSNNIGTGGWKLDRRSSSIISGHKKIITKHLSRKLGQDFS
jgi:hypothetical protein